MFGYPSNNPMFDDPDWPMPNSTDYDGNPRGYKLAYAIWRAVRGDGVLNREEKIAKANALRDCEMPNWHLRAHP